MTGQARHGLHLAGDSDAQAAEPITLVQPNGPRASLPQSSPAVRAAGHRRQAECRHRRPSADVPVALSTVDGGPPDWAVDLPDVFAIEEDEGASSTTSATARRSPPVGRRNRTADPGTRPWTAGTPCPGQD
jgi:hypothetical protein